MRRTVHPRGTAYVLVMGIALIVTVLGVGSLMAARSYARATSAATDWEEAGTLAFSATEQAVAYLSAQAAAKPTGWRAAYVSGQTALVAPLGRGTFSWALKDETDGNLSEDYLRPARLYGMATVNRVTRVYSVQLMPGGSPLDVLHTSLHASGAVQLNGPCLAGTGPVTSPSVPPAGVGVFSSNGAVTLCPQLWGNVEAASTTGPAPNTRVGTNTVPAAAKVMPAAQWPTLMTYYNSVATPLGLAATGGGTYQMNKFLLSPTVNPFGGSVNAAGIYSLTLTGGGGGGCNFQLTNGRILGTLIVTAQTNSQVNINAGVCWQAVSPKLPALIVSGTNLTVTINLGNNWLSESNLQANFNPAGSPYDGLTNATMTDAYPSVVQGLIYVTGSGNAVRVQGNSCLQGTLICDGTVQVSGPAAVVQNTTTFANPPVGFALGNAVVEVPGSWRWDTLP